MCCGNRGGRRRPPAVAAVPGTEQVPAEYTGDRLELFSVRGPATRTRYYVSARPHERVILVYAEDLAGLVATREWQSAPLDGADYEGED